MMQGLSCRVACLVGLFVAGCTQVAGLSDYDVSDTGTASEPVSEPDRDADSEGTEPDLDGAVVDAPMDGGSSTGMSTPVDAAGEGGLIVDPWLSGTDASTPVDGASIVDAGPVCAAPNQMCGDRCVDADDPRHCGRCDHDCTALANVSGSVTCSHGECVVPPSSCAPGFAHCSTEPDNGCESDITGAARCGGCTNACGAAKPLCSPTTTSGTLSCVSDCVAPSPTKCGATCVDTNTSPANCGDCGNACPLVSRGTPTCSTGQCSFTCNANHHRCGTQCLPDDVPTSCGSSCTPCSAPANATATCTTGGTCDFVCNTNYHRCGNQCLPNAAIDSCGSACAPCGAAPANGTALCSAAGSCDFTCNTNYHRCGNACVPNNALTSCGSSCTPCGAAPANGTALCSAAGSCDFTCNTNYHRCGNACVANDSISQCGASCQACPQVANGAPQCAANACTTVCEFGSLSNGKCPAPPPPNYVFVSTGKLSTNSGIAAADTLCQNEAQNAGLPGTYRAFMSTETAGAMTRLASSRGWIRPDGKPFADRVEDFIASSTDDNCHTYYPPRLTATGVDIGMESVMTGATYSWTSRGGFTCENWTLSSGGTVSFGYSSASGSLWSGASYTGCGSQYRVSCFGVGVVSKVNVTPATGRRAFISKSGWSSGGGIASADALCQTEATNAGFAGTFKALLATNGASAASRFDTNGAPWVRPDGVPVMPTAAQVFQSNVTAWDVPLNTTADLTKQYGNYGLWSGAPVPGAGVNLLTLPGTADSTCDSWASNAEGSGKAAFGLAGHATLLNAFGDLRWGCNYNNKVVCLQL